MSIGTERLAKSSILGMWPLMFFIIGLNSLILYLFLQEEIFLYISLATLLLIFQFLKGRVTNLLNRNKRAESISAPISIRDVLGLAKDYYIINKRYIFASAFGILLMSLVVSQSTIVAESYRQYAFDQFILDDDQSTFQFSISSADYGNYSKWQPFLDLRIDSWMNFQGLELGSMRSYGVVTFRIIMGQRFNLDVEERWIDYARVDTRGLTPEYYNLISQLPSFPDDLGYDDVNSLLVLPVDLIRANQEIGTEIYEIEDFITEVNGQHEFNILVDNDIIQGAASLDFSIGFTNITFAIDRVWQLQDRDLGYIRSQNLKIPKHFEQGTLFTKNGLEWDIFNQLQVANALDLNQLPYVWGSTDKTVGFEAIIYTKVPLIKDMELEIYKNLIQRTKLLIDGDLGLFETTLSPHLPQYQITYVVSSSLQTLITTYLEFGDNLERIMFMSAVPLLIISAFLLFFSLSLIEKRKERIMAKMKIRGSSEDQIRLVLIIEMVIQAVFAGIIGFLLSFLTTPILLKSSGIFEFNGPEIPLIIPTDLLWRLPALGFLITLDFNLISFFNISKIKLEESVMANEYGNSFWQKKNLDLIFFLLSGAYWIIVPNINTSDLPAELTFQVGLISIVAFLISFPFVVSRIFIPLIAFIFGAFIRGFDIFSLSAKNIVRYKRLTSLLVVILLTSFMLSFFGLIFSATMFKTMEEQSRYKLGADVYIQGIDINDPEQLAKLDIEGVVAYSEINVFQYRAQAWETPTEDNPNQVPTFHYVGINPFSFSNAAFWNPGYHQESLDNITAQLNEEFSFGLHSLQANGLDLLIGDHLEFRHGFQGLNIISFELSLTFEFFPRLILQTPEVSSNQIVNLDDIYLLMNFESVETIAMETNRATLDVYQTGAYLKLAADADADFIKTELFKRFSSNEEVIVQTFEDNNISFFSTFDAGSDSEGPALTFNPLTEFENKFAVAGLHAILLVSFLITIIATIFYSYVILTIRQNEVGVYRALGMVQRQITLVFVIEIFLIILVSLVFSFAAGLFMAYATILLIAGQNLEAVPPFELTIPVAEFTIIVITAAFVSFLVSYFPIRRAASKQTGSILRAI
ncbi:MAG: FtsX-like permease family protein [Candidatus Heimdallarchaeota archaeon]|nr:FtsX-like permease family protein [Candidatus Heimdallarchaeota archaeon]